MSEELTTADRDEEAAWVLQWLYGPSSVFAVEADSPEEATAFFYAILNELPTDYRVHYLSRTIVISNSDEARFLSDSLSPLIFVLDLADPGFSALLAQHGHHVLLTGVAIATGSANSVRLAQPFRETIRNSLNNMGVSEDAAQALARDCGRSIAVLRRLIPSAPGSELPRWANAENARAIIPALLVGSWDEANEADRKVLEKLTGKSYDEWISFAVEQVSSPDSPLRKTGNLWKIVSVRTRSSGLPDLLSRLRCNASVLSRSKCLASATPHSM